MVNFGLAKSRGSLPFKDEIASSLRSSQRGKNDQISRIEERNPGLQGFAQLRCCAPRKNRMNDQRAELAPCRKELQGRRTQYPEGTMSRPTGLRPTSSMCSSQKRKNMKSRVASSSLENLLTNTKIPLKSVYSKCGSSQRKHP